MPVTLLKGWLFLESSGNLLESVEVGNFPFIFETHQERYANTKVAINNFIPIRTGKYRI
jgi:hypothetical protein